MRVAELDGVSRPVPKATGIPEGIPTQPAIEGVPEVYRRKKTALRGLSAFGIQVAKPGRIFVCDNLSVALDRRLRQAVY